MAGDKGRYVVTELKDDEFVFKSPFFPKPTDKTPKPDLSMVAKEAH